MSETDHNDIKMIDITQKPVSNRTAKAVGVIRTTKKVIRAIKDKKVFKGDVFSVAQIAGIVAAKNVAISIPLCHPLALTYVHINIMILDDEHLKIESEVANQGKTGPDVEAMTAISGAALTIFDMCKSLDKEMVIEKICLIEKTGGKSGTFKRKNSTR